MEAKPVLLAFVGSDWCATCIRFDKKVIHDPLFKEYSKDHLVLLLADFPQQKNLAPDIVKKNDSLAAIYNPEGVFPKFILVNSNTPGGFKQVAYTTQTASEFISDVKKKLSALRSYE